MTLTVHTPCTAFLGHRRLAAGSLADVALAVKTALDEATPDHRDHVLAFDDTTGRVVDIDTRGSRDDVLARLARAHASMDAASADTAQAADAASAGTAQSHARRGRGRPRLGVVAREVTLLPRHWEWLNAQPGGASVVLRKLVETGMRDDRAREHAMREAAYRFMSAMAGDMPGFEEATRALFAGDMHGMSARMAPWPADIREHALRLAFGKEL
jgi:hypothetical protein